MLKTTSVSFKEGASPMHSSRLFPRGRAAGAVAGALLAVAWCAGAASAQGVESEQLPAVKSTQGKAPKAAAGPAGGGGDSAGLRERVEQLEGQLLDLQVVIGTLESLARTGGAVSAPARSETGGNFAAGDQGRLDILETQIRALTAQVEQLAAEVRANAQRRSDAGGTGFGDEAPQTSRFGSTTVTSDHADPSAGFGETGGGFADPAPPGPGPGSAPSRGSGFGAAAPPPASSGPAPPSTYGSETLAPPPGGDQLAAVEPGAGGSPKQLYDTALGHMLQQDFGAAQSGFRDFLRLYPQDPQAPNALFWLGETHYAQKNYSDAAEAFDLVVTAYSKSNKAADAQLKRGMSLAQLGKRPDACAAFKDVGSKFPNAPTQLKAKAQSERQRIGCP